MKKNGIGLLLIIFLLGSFRLYALDASFGVHSEGGITRGHNNLGLYRFVGTINGSRTTALRSSNQVVQFYGGVGMFFQLDIHSIYSTLAEMTYLFNRGMSFSGNYDANIIQEQVGHRPLVGQLNYSWQALSLNFINKLHFIRASDFLSVHALLGPGLSINVSQSILEDFEPEYSVASPPYHKKQRRLIPIKQRLDVGLIAGLGSEFNFANYGRLHFSIRTSWYFIPQFSTYLSGEKKVKVSHLMSLHLGYSFNLP